MPNQNILIDTLSLQEAKDSSAIENIITTHDDLYRSDYIQKQYISHAAKEVHNYAETLRNGFQKIQNTRLLTSNDILTIQTTIEQNQTEYRKQTGTTLRNEQTGEIIYTPPQHPDAIIALMSNLEIFMNTSELCDWDPLVKMAVIHHQFESIHPFYDGNGRTGRVLNILYLVLEGLLDTPILYLSRYINQYKITYYDLLQKTRDTNEWSEWILFMLDAVEQTAKQTTAQVLAIKQLMQEYKHIIRKFKPKIYSQDLLNNLFRPPYTKIDFVCNELQINRKTASKYLEDLVSINLLSKHRIGWENYYLNNALFNLFAN